MSLGPYLRQSDDAGCKMIQPQPLLERHVSGDLEHDDVKQRLVVVRRGVVDLDTGELRP